MLNLPSEFISLDLNDRNRKKTQSTTKRFLQIFYVWFIIWSTSKAKPNLHFATYQLDGLFILKENKLKATSKFIYIENTFIPNCFAAIANMSLCVCIYSLCNWVECFQRKGRNCILFLRCLYVTVYVSDDYSFYYYISFI